MKRQRRHDKRHEENDMIFMRSPLTPNSPASVSASSKSPLSFASLASAKSPPGSSSPLYERSELFIDNCEKGWRELNLERMKERRWLHERKIHHHRNGKVHTTELELYCVLTHSCTLQDLFHPLRQTALSHPDYHILPHTHIFLDITAFPKPNHNIASSSSLQTYIQTYLQKKMHSITKNS